MTLALAKTLFVAVWFGAFFIAERMAAAVSPPQSKRRLYSNLLLWVVNFLLSPLIVLPLAAWGAQHQLWVRPDYLTGVVGFVLSLLVMDFWTYWVHRAYHEVDLMWRLHAPHHLDEHLDTTSAVRFHFGEVILSAALRLVPIFIFAIPFSHVVIFETLLLSAAIFHHSNVRLPGGMERSLSKVIVTPSIHWVHHHARRVDTDSNYASLLSLWDPLFGTRSATNRTPEMKIGVEGVEDKPILGLILSPFGKVK